MFRGRCMFRFRNLTVTLKAIAMVPKSERKAVGTLDSHCPTPPSKIIHYA